jgi:putative lipoprotein
MYKFLCFGLLVLLLISCGKSKEDPEAFGDIRGVTWQLSDMGDKAIDNNIITTLVFGDDNKISGKGGCNNYFGTYDLYSNGITISDIGSTRKMCSEEIMEQEMTYLDILGKTKSIKFNDYKLEIDSTAEITSIKFIQEKNQ